jgi:hypothetical protein
MALPRVLLAVLIGAVISTPLTLAVFSAEIDAEVEVMAREADDEFNRQMEEDSRFADLPQLRQQIQVLQADIAQPVTDADVDADPAVVALAAQLTQVTEAHNAAAAAYLCEVDGTCGTGDPGIAASAEEKRAERDRLAAERDQLREDLAALEAAVREQLDAEEIEKTADQEVQLADLQEQVGDAEATRAAAIAAHEAEVGESDGILQRLSALGRIQDRDPLLGTAHLLLFLFMTALECLPIIFKTMLALAPPSLYERLVALDEERVEARVRLRMQTEYEEAETLARSALAAAEARAARTLEAESTATGMVLDAQLEVAREGVRRWRDEQFEQSTAGAGDQVEALREDPDGDLVLSGAGPDAR